MSIMSELDIKHTIRRYSDRLKQHGYSSKALGWLKGKQDIRFDVLTSRVNIENKTVLDIGCGFGDLNFFLEKKQKNYTYIGCDLCESFIDIARELHPQQQFLVGDFLEMTFLEKIDWAVASGPFNHRFTETDNLEFIYAMMQKTFDIVEEGFSFDFISTNVDFQEENIYYTNPSLILNFAYKLSRNILLRSDYMPFEFSIFVFKNDSFSREKTVFTKYTNENI